MTPDAKPKLAQKLRLARRLAGPEGKALTGGDEEDDAQQGLDYLDSVRSHATPTPTPNPTRTLPLAYPYPTPPAPGPNPNSNPNQVLSHLEKKTPTLPLPYPTPNQVLSHLEKKTGPLSQTIMHEQEQVTPYPTP